MRASPTFPAAPGGPDGRLAAVRGGPGPGGGIRRAWYRRLRRRISPPPLEIRPPHRRRRALISVLPRAQIPPIRARSRMSRRPVRAPTVRRPRSCGSSAVIPAAGRRRLPRRLHRRLAVPAVPTDTTAGAGGDLVAAPVANTTTQAISQVQVSGCLSHCQGASQTQVASQQNQTVQAVSGAPHGSSAPQPTPSTSRIKQVQVGCVSACFGSTSKGSTAGLGPPRAVGADARARRGQLGASDARQRSDPEHDSQTSSQLQVGSGGRGIADAGRHSIEPGDPGARPRRHRQRAPRRRSPRSRSAACSTATVLRSTSSRPSPTPRSRWLRRLRRSRPRPRRASST